MENNKKSISEIRKGMHDKMSDLFDSLGIFFAFSEEQFKEKEKKDTIYVNGGSGMFIPKEKVKAFNIGFGQIDRETRAEYDKHITMDEYILYELNNHEAFYTSDLDDAFEAVQFTYPKCSYDDVYRVYCDHINSYV